MKNQKSILFHRASDNKPIGFDPEIIIGAIKKTSFGNFSDELDDDYTNIIIDTHESEEVFYVNESVEKVYDMLKNVKNDKCGFIKLHEAEDNTVCVFNYTYMNTYSYDEDEGYTSIFLCESDTDVNYLDVNESPEKIHQMIMADMENSK